MMILVALAAIAAARATEVCQEAASPLSRDNEFGQLGHFCLGDGECAAGLVCTAFGVCSLACAADQDCIGAGYAQSFCFNGAICLRACAAPGPGAAVGCDNVTQPGDTEFVSICEYNLITGPPNNYCLSGCAFAPRPPFAQEVCPGTITNTSVDAQRGPPRHACTTDEQCAPGLLCWAGVVCTRQCTNNTDCADGGFPGAECYTGIGFCFTTCTLPGDTADPACQLSFGNDTEFTTVCGLALGAGFTACSSQCVPSVPPTPPPGDFCNTGIGGTTGQLCTADADCGPGLSCLESFRRRDTRQRVRICTSACNTTADCATLPDGANLVCETVENRQCLRACTSLVNGCQDGDTSQTSYCLRSTINVTGGDPYLPYNNYCVYDCDPIQNIFAPPPLPLLACGGVNGSVLQPGALQIGMRGCSWNADCQPGLSCADVGCTLYCTSDTDCPSGFVCLPSTAIGRPVDAVGFCLRRCSEPHQIACPTGGDPTIGAQQCLLNQVGASLGTDSYCGYACLLQPQPGQTQPPALPPPLAVCAQQPPAGGGLGFTCDSNFNCAPGLACDPSTLLCELNTAGCLLDIDCPVGTICGPPNRAPFARGRCLYPCNGTAADCPSPDPTQEAICSSDRFGETLGPVCVYRCATQTCALQGTRTARAGHSCASPYDCDPSLQCVGGVGDGDSFCTKDCVTQSDCSGLAGSSCVSGFCLDACVIFRDQNGTIVSNQTVLCDDGDSSTLDSCEAVLGIPGRRACRYRCSSTPLPLLTGGVWPVTQCSAQNAPVAGAGTIGFRCQNDGDCLAGMTCLQPQGVCSVQCLFTEDCRVYGFTSDSVCHPSGFCFFPCGQPLPGFESSLCIDIWTGGGVTGFVNGFCEELFPGMPAVCTGDCTGLPPVPTAPPPSSSGVGTGATELPTAPTQQPLIQPACNFRNFTPRSEERR